MLWVLDSDLSWPEAVLVEVILAGIAWNIAKLLTRNVRHFFELRHAIRREVLGVEGAGPWPSDQAEALRRGDPEPTVFRELGFQMLSLAQTAWLARRALRLMGFDPIEAGDNLISLAHDPALGFRRRRIAQALRFKLVGQPR
jgi:hypothetical protein